MELVLTPHEQHSPLGQKLRAHYTDRLQTLRELNDKSMPEPDRAALIAEIKVVKVLLKALTVEPLRAVALG